MTTNTDKLSAHMALPSPDEIRLACGEISPNEMRTVLAVLGWYARALAAMPAESVKQAEPVGEIYSHNCNSLGIVHAVVRFDGPFDPNDQHTWPAQGSKVYLAAPAERAPAPTVADGWRLVSVRSLENIRDSLRDYQGGHSYSAEWDGKNLDWIDRLIEDAPTAQEASKPVQAEAAPVDQKVPFEFDYLAEFYKVDTASELIAAQAYHIEKLQNTVRERGLLLPAFTRVREG